MNHYWENRNPAESETSRRVETQATSVKMLSQCPTMRRPAAPTFHRPRPRLARNPPPELRPAANAAISAAPVWKSSTSGTGCGTAGPVGLEKKVAVNADHQRGAWGQEAQGVVLAEVNGRDKQDRDGGGLRGGDGRHARHAQTGEEKGVVVSGRGVGCEGGDILNRDLVRVERPVVSSPITCSDAACVTGEKPRAPARSVALVESGEYYLKG